MIYFSQNQENTNITHTCLNNSLFQNQKKNLNRAGNLLSGNWATCEFPILELLSLWVFVRKMYMHSPINITDLSESQSRSF